MTKRTFPKRTFSGRTFQRREQLTVPASFGLHNPADEPIYTADEQAIIDEFMAKPIKQITKEEFSTVDFILDRARRRKESE